jgi:hypothetical protein
MRPKNAGRESDPGAAFCANVAIDSTATGKAVSMASMVVRDMGFSRLGDMAIAMTTLTPVHRRC